MSSMPRLGAYVHGVALQTGWADATASLTDMIFRAVSSAVEASRAPMARIDSVVLAAHDLVDGRSLSSMVTAPAAGAYLRDEIRLAEDGLAALSLASARIEAGESEFAIVAAWGRASEGDLSQTSRAQFDPFLVQPFGLDEYSISAFRMSAWASRYGEAVDMRRAAIEVRAERARRNPRAVAALHRPRLNPPLLPDEAPRLADIAVAAVIGREPGAVRIAGVGHSAESGMFGARDLLAWRALTQAVCQARGGVALGDIDIFQVAGTTLVDEAVALEAIGLAPPGGGFSTYAGTEGVNPSGGGEGGWCFPAGGLVNFVEAYLQLAGQAGEIQATGAPRRALATGLSPMGGQIAHAVMLVAA